MDIAAPRGRRPKHLICQRRFRFGTGSLLLALALSQLSSFVTVGESYAQARAGAKALESRLYAPCCYGSTLDVHDSELAKSLRDEIEARLGRGETSETIQTDLVGRYGEKILAARSDEPIRYLGEVVAVLFVASAIALGFLVRRWTRRSRRPSTAFVRDGLDERIDEDLAELDTRG